MTIAVVLVIVFITLFVGPSSAWIAYRVQTYLADRDASDLVGIGAPYLVACGYCAAWAFIIISTGVIR